MNQISRVFAFLLMVLMVSSCAYQDKDEYKVKSLKSVNLEAGNFHVRNFPARIRAVNDSEIILIPIPSDKLIKFNTYSGDSVASLTLSKDQIDILKNKTVIPEMKGVVLISRDSFVAFTRYDPGSIEFSDISITDDHAYVTFNLPAYYIDTVHREYRYNPAVYIGEILGDEIKNIKYLPGYPFDTSIANPYNLLYRDWPYMPFGFKVLGTEVLAFNMADTARFRGADVPVLMLYGNCSELKCTAMPDRYPAIFLNRGKEIMLKSNFESGRVLFNKNGKEGIAWWDGNFYRLPEGERIYDWLGDESAGIVSFDFIPGSENLLIAVILSGNDTKNKARASYLKVWDVQDQEEILRHEIADSTHNVNSMNIDLLGRDLFYLNFEDYELYHFRLE